MKKTKVIVKKKKPSREVSLSKDKRQPRQKQKQKQKQNVSVNVNIDQSKRTTQRKPKADKTSNQSTTMAHGENYVRSNPYSFLPPAVYQPPFNQVYGQLQPIGNTSDSMSRMIANQQEYNSVVPRQNQQSDSLYNQAPTYNIMNVALQKKEITDKLNTDFQSAMEFAKSFNQPTEPKIEIKDEDKDEDEDEDENDDWKSVPELMPNDENNEIQELQPSPPPPIETPSQSQSQSQSNSQSNSQSQIIDEKLAIVKNKTTYLNSLTADAIRNYAQRYGIITQMDNNTVGGKNVYKKLLIPQIIEMWQEKNN